MEYPFLYAPSLRSALCSMYCTTHGVYRNGRSFYICKSDGGISCKWECHSVTTPYDKQFERAMVIIYLLCGLYAPENGLPFALRLWKNPGHYKILLEVQWKGVLFLKNNLFHCVLFKKICRQRREVETAQMFVVVTNGQHSKYDKSAIITSYVVKLIRPIVCAGS